MIDNKQENILKARYIHTHSEQLNLIGDHYGLNVIVMNMSKRIHVTTKTLHKRLLMPYSVAAFSKDELLEIECLSETELLLLYCEYLDPDCERSIVKLRDEGVWTVEEEFFPHMKMDEALKAFATIMIDIYQDHLEDTHFLETKFREFFFILRRMHSIEDVCRLMSPMIASYDPVFRRTVLDRYCCSMSVKTLASSCGYNMKNFTLKFQEEFKQNPGTWLKRKLAEACFHLLREGSHTFQEIAEELGMSSQQQLTRFCKREFGKTPTEIVRASHSSK